MDFAKSFIVLITQHIDECHSENTQKYFVISNSAILISVSVE